MRYLTIMLDSEQIESMFPRKQKASMANSIMIFTIRKLKGGFFKCGGLGSKAVPLIAPVEAETLRIYNA